MLIYDFLGYFKECIPAVYLNKVTYTHVILNETTVLLLKLYYSTLLITIICELPEEVY